MIRRVVASALMGLALAAPLTAPAAATNVPTTTGTAVVTWSKAEKYYLRWVWSREPLYRALPSSLLVRTGKTTCSALRAGISAERIIQIGLDNDLTWVQVTATLTGAGRYLCRDQWSKTRGYE